MALLCDNKLSALMWVMLYNCQLRGITVVMDGLVSRHLQLQWERTPTDAKQRCSCVKKHRIYMENGFLYFSISDLQLCHLNVAKNEIEFYLTKINPERQAFSWFSFALERCARCYLQATERTLDHPHQLNFLHWFTVVRKPIKRHTVPLACLP